MRRLTLLAATALFATQPAFAGITARYRVGEGPGQGLMVIEVNDRGDSRTRMADGRIMIVLGGTAYVVETDQEGTFAVLFQFARSEDNVEVEGTRIRSHEGGEIDMSPRSPDQRVQLRRGGSEVVGGHHGTVWRLFDPTASAGRGEDEFVVSADPELAPLNAIIGPGHPPDPAFDPKGAAAARWTMYRRGAILREGRFLQLESAEIRSMPAAFTLPGPVLDRAAYVARRRRTGR